MRIKKKNQAFAFPAFRETFPNPFVSGHYKDVREIEKVRRGLISSHQYCCHGRTSLAKSHLLSDISMDQLGSSSYVTCASLEQVENRYLVVGKSSGGIAIYDTEKVKENNYPSISRIKAGSRGSHSCGISCIQWYPVDAGLFCTSGSDSRVKIWDPNTMKKVEDFKFECQIYYHHMSPVAASHSVMAVAGEKGELILCDLRTGSASHRMHGHDGPIQVVQWTRHNQNCLASGGRDRTIRLWDVRSGKSCLKILDSENSSEFSSRLMKRAKKIPFSHSSRITSLCFTSDGLWLISFDYDGTLKLWNSNTGKNMGINFGHIGTDIKRSLSMAVSHQTYPDLVYVPSDSKILTFEVTTGRLVNALEGHLTSVLGVIFNPNSDSLYSYGSDRNFLTWIPADLLPVKADLDDCSTTKDTPRQTFTQDSWSSDEG